MLPVRLRSSSVCAPFGRAQDPQGTTKATAVESLPKAAEGNVKRWLAKARGDLSGPESASKGVRLPFWRACLYRLANLITQLPQPFEIWYEIRTFNGLRVLIDGTKHGAIPKRAQ